MREPHDDGEAEMMWDNDWGHWGWGWFFMALWMLAFWGLVIWAVATLLRRDSGQPPREHLQEKTARQILDERFARGEIDPDEYRARLELLEHV